MSFDALAGHTLEQRIAQFLGSHGYASTTNVRVVGRSGATHELDVVADKSDDLTTFRMVVECKANTAAIDKEVVFKLAAELADIGAARGIIVSLSGWTVQAAQAAAQSNIELWGPDELRKRLGTDLIHELQGARWPTVAAQGLPFTVALEQAHPKLQRQARGRLGFGGDELAWVGRAWLPAWSLQIAITRMEGHLHRVPRVSRIWNLFEGMQGVLMASSAAPPSLADVDVGGGYLEALVHKGVIDRDIRKNFDQMVKVKTAAAKQRYAATLARYGLHLPFTGVAVEETTLIYYPLWIGFLRKGARERVAVVDGLSGADRPDLCESLTANVHVVRNSLTPR